ncbi:MAG: TolC family protein [Gammaproteobacteria bacterium]|nr:TolC family protein [Gammaproteobacteria bacterium]
MQAATVATAENILPEPLTLEYALSLVDEPHPDLESIIADRDLAQAGVLSVDAMTGFRSSIEARAQWIDPGSAAIDQSHNDNQASLLIEKQLYDFGYSGALLKAAQQDVQQREFLIRDLRNKRRTEIMARYFDVLLSDLEYIRDNEAMAVDYVRFDNIKDRHALGQVSDIDLKEAESVYQQSRRIRYASQTKQRLHRARLALALNRPESLSSSLALPALKNINREIPELDVLYKEARQNNLVVHAMRKQLEAAQMRVMAARAGGGPVLRGEIEANIYERQYGSRDDMQAGLVLEIPLSKGGSVKADIAREQANVRRYQAELVAKEREVDQKMLELWLQLDVLRVQREEVNVLIDYRDLYLDRSRALYELEVKTDLGDSMVRFSDARLREAQTRYAIELVWAKLDALSGRENP